MTRWLWHGHLPAVGAAEVVRVVCVILEHEGLLVDDQVAPLADVLAQALGFLTVVARAAQVPRRVKAGARAKGPLLCLLPPHPPFWGLGPWNRAKQGLTQKNCQL